MILSILTTLILSSNAQMRPMSFEETHRRYLAPLDLIEIYMDRFPYWANTFSCDPYYAFSVDADSIRVLLGENRPVTGEPDSSSPSAGLVSKLKDCVQKSLVFEVQKISGTLVGPEPKIERLKHLIPCRTAKCSTSKNEWASVALKDFSESEQKEFISELIVKIWGSLRIYEESNLGSTRAELIDKIRSQLADKKIFEVYAEVQTWAALRDELIMF